MRRFNRRANLSMGGADLVLAGAMVLLVLLEVQQSTKDMDGHALCAGALAAGALAVRNRYPVATFVVSLVAAVVAMRSGGAELIAVAVSLLVALYTLTVRRRIRCAAAGAVLVLASWLAVLPGIAHNVKGAVIGVVCVVFVVMLGRARRLDSFPAAQLT